MENSIIIYNGRIFDGQTFIDGFAIHIQDGIIQSILTQDELDQAVYDAQFIDANGCVIMPGMIDLQLNGCGGVLFNDEQSQAVLEIMNQTNVQYGCTGFVATLITSDDEKIKRALQCVDKAINQGIGVLGLHLEGPMISVEKKGIHQSKFIRQLSKEMLDEIFHYKKNIKMMTIAPEAIDAEVLQNLKEEGLSLSIGHSNATYAECEEKGTYFTHATHLWNAMRPLEGREPGVVGYVLEQKQMFTGIIADGVHVHPKNIRLASELLPETLYVTTDAVTPAGKKDIHTFTIEGNLIYVKGNICQNKDGKFGGANTTMIESVQYLVETVQLSYEQAFQMATSIPARAIYEENKRGYLTKGLIADIVVVDIENWDVSCTLQGGNIVYRREREA